MSFLSKSAFHSHSARRRRGGAAVLADINVTPMVDVMLVLLIIFMVAAPLLTVGVAVDLPKTKAQALTDQKEPVTLTIKKDGTLFIQETEVEQTALLSKLRAISQHNPDVKLYVRADKGLAYGRVMEVMGDLSTGGFTKFAFITDHT